MQKTPIFDQLLELLTGESLSDGILSSSLPSGTIFDFLSRGGDGETSLCDLAQFVQNTLSRKDEHGNANLDRWGRFEHDKSFLVQNGLDQSPFVDEIIKEIIRQFKLKRKSIWPEGKIAAVCLSHDVDAVSGFNYMLLRQLLWFFRGSLNLVKLKIEVTRTYCDQIRYWNKLKRNSEKDPLFAFDRWMELEEHYGYRSTFFFLSRKNSLRIEGRKYSYKDPKVRRVIRKLDDVGWEVALHGSRYNNENLDYLVIQKDRIEQILGKEIDGCRHHWLRVLFPSSWHLYGNAGFKYSSNMGWYHPYNGFRAGTCFPYWPLDGSEKRGEGILEIPFQLMDENSIEKTNDYLNLFFT